MNKRFSKLAEKATLSILDSMTDEQGITQFVETFGKLVVKDIIKVCEKHPDWTGKMIAEHIKQSGLLD
jgi:hypothetical protein